MKSLIVAIVALLLLGWLSCAHALTLVWDPSTGTVEGYIVEASVDDGLTWPYSYTVTETNLSLDDKHPFNTTVFYRVRAYNAAGSSAPCDPVSHFRPPFTPPEDNPMPPVEMGTDTPTNVTFNDP